MKLLAKNVYKIYILLTTKKKSEAAGLRTVLCVLGNFRSLVLEFAHVTVFIHPLRY